MREKIKSKTTYEAPDITNLSPSLPHTYMIQEFGACQRWPTEYAFCVRESKHLPGYSVKNINDLILKEKYYSLYIQCVTVLDIHKLMLRDTHFFRRLLKIIK